MHNIKCVGEFPSGDHGFVRRLLRTARVAAMVLLVPIVVAAGCGRNTGDGSGQNENNETEEYLLQVDVQETSAPITSYLTAVASREEFVMSYGSVGDAYYDVTKVIVDWDYGTLTFGSYLVLDDYVEEGQAVATFSVTYDPIEKAETQILLERSQEAYEKYVEEQTELFLQRAEVIEELPEDSEERAELQESYDDAYAAYEKYCEETEETLAELQRKVDAFAYEGQVLEVTAPCSGYFSADKGSDFNAWQNWLRDGMSIGGIYSKKTDLYMMANTGNITGFLNMSVFSYGQSAVLTYKDENGQEHTMPGEVVMSDNILPDELKTGYVLVQAELPEGMEESPKSVNISVEVMRIPDAVIIPDSTLGSSYVTVVTENGLERRYVTLLATADHRCWIAEEELEGCTLVIINASN